MEIKIDFVHDFAQLIEKVLKNKGIKIPSKWDDEDICLNYFELQKRLLINSTAYKVCYSKELLDKLPSLTRDEQQNIKEIESRLKKAESVVDFMSKLVTNTDMNKSDFFLKNWDIYHLHLEKLKSSNQHYTNPNLLFFHVTKDTVYFIDVIRHPCGSTWFAKSLIEIEHNNWPFLHIKINGREPTVYVPDSQMHEALKHFVTISECQGDWLIPSSGGVVASGNSSDAVKKRDILLGILKGLESDLKNKENEIVKRIKTELNIDNIDSLEYELTIEQNALVVYETKYKVQININLIGDEAVFMSEIVNAYQKFK